MSTATIRNFERLKAKRLEAEMQRLRDENDRLRILLGLKKKLNRRKVRHGK